MTTTRSSIRTPKRAGQVDAGLDRDDVRPPRSSSSERGREARPLVDLEADAVAEPVAEVLAVAGLGDHLAGDRVDLLAARPRRATASSAATCARSDQLVDLARLARPGSPVAKVRVQSEQ